MARTALVPTVIARYPALPVSANSLDVVLTIGTATDGFSVPATGRECIIVTNVNAAPQTVTLKSTPDAQGRTGDITAYSLSQNEIAVFFPPVNGFIQADGSFYIDVAHNDIHVGVAKLPA